MWGLQNKINIIFNLEVLRGTWSQKSHKHTRPALKVEFENVKKKAVLIQEMESQRKWLWSQVGESVFLFVRLWPCCVNVTNSGVIQQNTHLQAERAPYMVITMKWNHYQIHLCSSWRHSPQNPLFLLQSDVWLSYQIFFFNETFPETLVIFQEPEHRKRYVEWVFLKPF